MPTYTAQPGSIDGLATVELADAGAQRVRIACHGAALLNFEVTTRGGVHDIAWGYRDGKEILARSGSHFAILAPFAGRVGDARYRFDGAEYDLEPGVEGVERGFRHGFVRDADFEVMELATDAQSARATLATRAIRHLPGYPFAIDLALTFTLDRSGLTLQAVMRNVGDHAAPCFFGWHAYLRPGSGRADDWNLTIPASAMIATDKRMIPLPGDAALVDLDDASDFDFRGGRTIGASVLDTGFAGLAPSPDERLRSTLHDPESGLGVGVWHERGVVHAFTGDTLGAGARSAVALEPMEAMADAFNRHEWAERIRLDAGARRRFRCGIEWSERA